MKKYFGLFVFLVSVALFAGAPPGTNVGSVLSPSDTNDNYATHNAIWGRGGHRTCYDTIGGHFSRDSIPAARREIGMTVYDTTSQKTWRLVGGIANSDWVLISTGIAADSASKIPNTAVTPGTYGGSDLYTQFTVNQQGQLTYAGYGKAYPDSAGKAATAVFSDSSGAAGKADTAIAANRAFNVWGKLMNKGIMSTYGRRGALQYWGDSLEWHDTIGFASGASFSDNSAHFDNHDWGVLYPHADTADTAKKFGLIAGHGRADSTDMLDGYHGDHYDTVGHGEKISGSGTAGILAVFNGTGSIANSAYLTESDGALFHSRASGNLCLRIQRSGEDVAWLGSGTTSGGKYGIFQLFNDTSTVPNVQLYANDGGSPSWVCYGANPGNFGIGIRTPYELLHVNGAMRWGGLNSRYAFSSTDGSGLYIEHHGTDSATSETRIQTSKAGDATNYTQLIINPYNGARITKVGTGSGDLAVGGKVVSEKDSTKKLVADTSVVDKAYITKLNQPVATKTYDGAGPLDTFDMDIETNSIFYVEHNSVTDQSILLTNGEDGEVVEIINASGSFSLYVNGSTIQVQSSRIFRKISGAWIGYHMM